MKSKLAIAVISLTLVSACAIHPPGEREEREKIAEAGKPYLEKGELPELGEGATAEEFLRYAFLSNAELEQRYWEWKAAIEQVPQDASPPNVALSFSYLFSSDNMKAWDRTTLGISNDPMANIPLPTKLETAGRRALEEARAAGLRFEAAKFLLQGKVLAEYYELALHVEQLRIQQEAVALLRQSASLAAIRVQTGSGGQQELLRAQTELDLAENSLKNLHASLPPHIARMNALLGRGVEAPFPLPKALPSPRAFFISDAELIQLGSERSPELAALAREIAGKEEALSLARQAQIPDFNLSFSVMGSISQMLGGSIVLPVRQEAIRAGIEQAQANLRAMQAARVQYSRDLAASFVMNLASLRNDERQIELFEKTILPRALQTVQATQSSYSSTRSSYLEILDAQRLLLDARLTLAQLRAEREKALAAIETWSAVDFETLETRGMSRASGPTRSSMGSMR